MGVMSFAGMLTMLRVHEAGSGWGPAHDAMDVEVVFTLAGVNDRAFGFQLRKDDRQPVHQAMLDLLRDGFTHQWTVHTDADVADGRLNSVALRIWLTRPLDTHPAPHRDLRQAVSVG